MDDITLHPFDLVRRHCRDFARANSTRRARSANPPRLRSLSSASCRPFPLESRTRGRPSINQLQRHSPSRPSSVIADCECPSTENSETPSVLHALHSSSSHSPNSDSYGMSVTHLSSPSKAWVDVDPEPFKPLPLSDTNRGFSCSQSVYLRGPPSSISVKANCDSEFLPPCFDLKIFQTFSPFLSTCHAEVIQALRSIYACLSAGHASLSNELKRSISAEIGHLARILGEIHGLLKDLPFMLHLISLGAFLHRYVSDALVQLVNTLGSHLCELLMFDSASHSKDSMFGCVTKNATSMTDAINQLLHLGRLFHSTSHSPLRPRLQYAIDLDDDDSPLSSLTPSPRSLSASPLSPAASLSPSTSTSESPSRPLRFTRSALGSLSFSHLSRSISFN